MVAREVYEHEVKRFKKIEAKHKGCATRMRAIEEMNLENLKAKNDIQKELDDFALKVQSLEIDMKKEAEKVVHQQIMRTRVVMMLEYHRGEWRSWDVIDTKDLQ